MDAKQRMGLFGGLFNPFHLGHLNSALSVGEKMQLQKIFVVPSYQSPLRPPVEGPSAEQRLEMTQLGVGKQHSQLEVVDCEVQRGGISYTIDTIHWFRKKYSDAQLVLIVGLDQFEHFDKWKEFKKILQNVDLVVTSRPGAEFPYETQQFPQGLQELIEDFDGKSALLRTGRTVFFVQLKDVDVSATEIRRRLRSGQPIHSLVPGPVAEYIGKHKFYESVNKSIGDFDKFTRFCAKTVSSKAGINIQAYDLRKLGALSEYTLISSGTSTRHTTALSEHLVREVKKEYGVWPLSVEGQKEGRWVVVDYGALIVHLFYDYLRQEYKLEELWRKGQLIEIDLSPESGRKSL